MIYKEADVIVDHRCIKECPQGFIGLSGAVARIGSHGCRMDCPRGDKKSDGDITCHEAVDITNEMDKLINNVDALLASIEDELAMGSCAWDEGFIRETRELLEKVR